MASDAEIVIGIRGDVGGARTIKRSLDDVSNSADKATGQTARLEKQMGSLNMAAVALRGVFSGLIAGFSVRELTRVTDAFTTMETQLKNVTNSTRQYNQVFNDLFRIAQRNGDSFEGLSRTYVQLNSSLPDVVRNSYDLVKVTELLSRGFAASGSSAQAASATMIQLTQGLAGNFANAAQEINSLIEGAPLLAKIIAVELGGNAATDLKRFAEAGELTRESFLNALLAAEQAIAAYEIPETVSRSLQRLSNSFLRIVGESNSVMGAARSLAGAIDLVADSLDNIIKLLGIATGALAGFFLAANIGVVTTFAANIGVAIASMASMAGFAVSVMGPLAALRLGLMSLGAVTVLNPIGLAAAAIGGLVAAVIFFKDEFGGLAGLASEVVGNFAATIVYGMGEAGIAIDKLISKFADLTNFLTSGPAVLWAMAVGGMTYEQATNELRNYNVNRKANRSNVGGFSGQTPEQIRADVQRMIGEIGQWQRSVQGTPRSRSLGDFDVPFPILPELTNPTSPESVARGIEKTTTEATKLTKEIKDPMTDAVSDLSVAVERDLAGAFKEAFSGTEGSFERLIQGMKASFTDFLAEIVYQAAARPILMSVGLVGGGVSAASSSNLLGSILGSGSGGSSISLGSIFSNGFSALNSGLNTPIFGASSLIGKGINSIGSALGLTNANFIGPMLPGTSSLASAFTPMAGLGGFAGSTLANLIGLGGGTGGTIGGIAGSVAGTAIGANLGTILGLSGGPVGALIGGFAGTALGGLLGGKSTPSRAIGSKFRFQGGEFKNTFIGGDEYTQEQFNQMKKYSKEVEAGIAQLFEAIGATPEFLPNLDLGSTRREPGIAWVSSFSQPRNFSSFQQASDFGFNNVFSRAQLGGVSDEFEKIFQDIFKQGGSFSKNLEKVLEAKAIVDFIEGSDAENIVSPLQQVFDALEDQFDNLKKKAIELGLPVDKLTEAYEKQRDAIAKNALDPLQKWLDAQSLSGNSSLSAVDRLSLSRSRFDDALSEIGRGNYANIDNLTSLADSLLGAGRDVYASGEAFNALESFVRQSVAGVGETLGAPAGTLDAGMAEVALNTAQQNTILEQMNLQIQVLTEENRKLRKSMERIGNAVVVMTT